MDASPDQVNAGPVWTDQSQSLDVTCSGFSAGSKRIRATRDQLSSAQLAQLAALTLTTPTGSCVEDDIECGVTITATDGSVTTYISNEGGVCDSPTPVISYRSLALFLQTIPCLFAKQTTTTDLDGGVIPFKILPDARCFNGVFAGPPTTVQRVLAVGDPSVPRHLELDSCNGQGRSPAQVHPQLLASDGVTPLAAPWAAVTDPGADGTCQRLDYTFPAAGTYQLSIGLDQGFVPGDFYLRFY